MHRPPEGRSHKTKGPRPKYSSIQALHLPSVAGMRTCRGARRVDVRRSCLESSFILTFQPIFRADGNASEPRFVVALAVAEAVALEDAKEGKLVLNGNAFDQA